MFVYNAMLRGYVACSAPAGCLEFYAGRMRPSGVLPTSFTFSSLFKACEMVAAAGLGEGLHGLVWKCGCASHVFVQTGMLGFYAGCGRVGDARRVFDEMGERDGVAWTAMVAVLAESGDMVSAKGLFEGMGERNLAAWNAMIAGYGRIGDVESAVMVFDQMPVRDMVSWTAMISCYSRSGRFVDAIEAYKGMKVARVVPDEVAVASVLSACAHLGSLEFGKEVHLFAAEEGYCADVHIGSALIDMYAKCGCIEKSLLVFFKLPEKNLFCWNSMIEGLAAHGLAEEALCLFGRMEKEEIKPNGVTFVSVLSACTHAGLVEEGCRRFQRMKDDYLILPEVEHYGCIVDLLSRAGLLEEAMSLVKSMNVEPNSIVWGALLGGCKLHGNMEIGRIAAKELMVLEPENSGYYSLLVSLYAEASQWLNVASIRCKMKQMRVQKSPGNSSIDIGGTVCEFVASDITHPLFEHVSFLLAGLDGQIKLSVDRQDFGIDCLAKG